MNEAVSYHRFGRAMMADQMATGANLPCWMIFDDRYRKKYPLGILCLGTVEKPPFYACRIELRDLGSKGGLVTDVDGQVLDKDRRPIWGLYAIGNCASSPMGRACPGAGVTLGTTMIFGYVTSSHMAALQPGSPARGTKPACAVPLG